MQLAFYPPLSRLKPDISSRAMYSVQARTPERSRLLCCVMRRRRRISGVLKAQVVNLGRKKKKGGGLELAKVR
jgi:hypothetical protein